METFADRYVLTQEKPKAGGMAKVFKAIDGNNSGRLVAIKVFESAGAENEFIRESFARETEALSNLRHPNIVPLLDSDFEPDRRQLYIVLPWCDSTLKDLHGKNKAQDPMQFITELAQPLLDALSLAHSRRVLHRDVKPSNVLIDQDGIPRLADFGIAKLTDSLRAGVTMSSFASKPFSPPEQLAGQTSEQSDVYALGVTFVDCFTDVPDSATPTDIQQIISNLSLHQSFKSFLRRMTSPLTSDRPFNAMVAAEQIKDVLRDLRASALPRLDLHLRLSHGALSDARTLFETGSDTMRSVCDDLNSEDLSARLEENSTTDGEQVLLLGRELFYRAKRDNRDQSLLLIVSMYPPTPSKLEKMRQLYFPLRANFYERSPLSSSKASANLDKLYEALAESNAHRLAQARGSEEDELLDKWQRILSLKQAVEHRREEPVPYASFTRVGEGVIRFSLATDLSKSEQMALVGQTRRVITRDQKEILGEVDDVFDNQLDLYIVRGDPAMLNGKGRLLLDASASHTALARQRRALLEVRTRISRRTDLRDLLARPQESRSPDLEPNSVIDFFQELDPGKQNAIRYALASQDLITVAGPPGTGKTTWIAEFVAQTIKKNPDAKILLTGQTHTAVDNAVERVKRIAGGRVSGKELKVVRLGLVDRISSANAPYSLLNGLTSWLGEVKQDSANWLTEWSKSNNMDQYSELASAALTSLTSELAKHHTLSADLALLTEKRAELENLERQLESLEETLLQRSATLESLGSSAAVPDNRPGLLGKLIDLCNAHSEASLQIIDAYGAARAAGFEDVATLSAEISKLSSALQESDERSMALRTEIAAILNKPDSLTACIDELKLLVEEHEGVNSPEVLAFQKLKSLQSDWHQRLGSDKSFETLFVAEADIVAGTCIGVASRLMEGASFEVVIIDEASKATPTEALATMTMGKSWVLVGDDKQLPPFVDETLLDDDLLARFELTRQDLTTTLFDRMLSGLPATCKCELNVQHRMVKDIGDLISNCFYDGRLSTGRLDRGDEGIRKLMPSSIAWLSTSHLSNRYERSPGGKSYLNICEADHVCKLLELAESSLPPGKTYKVGVITGYGAQKELLQNMIKPSSEKWSCLQIEVNSVDAFQGREVDILFYSITRSNESGILGFLRSQERLNVALSRGRDSLIIVGDADFCRDSSGSENPFQLVLRYIDTNKISCKLLTLGIGQV